MILISSLGGGGAERATAAMAGWWIKAGHRVTVLLYGREQNKEYALTEGVEVAALGGSGGQGLLAALGRVRRIRAELDRIKPDVVIGMMSTANVLLALASSGRPWRTLGAERVSPVFEPEARIWRWLRAWTYGLLDLVVAQTSAAAEWLRRHTAARAVHVIPNAIAWPLPHTQGPPGAAPPPGGRRLLLAVGRLVPQKGFIELVGAFARCARANPDWDLVILGEGPEREAIEVEAARLGLSGRVRLPGRSSVVRDWYQAADLFVLSSRYEGFPNVLVEAMAAGLAVVSRDCPEGPADIIRDGVDGVLTPASDLDALSEALGRLMGDEGLRRRLGAEARAVRDRFSEAAIKAQWDALLSPPGS